MSVRIKMRYDNYATWESTDPTLLQGEFAVANNNGTIIVKVGTEDGQHWSAAPEISGTGTPIEGLDFTDLQAGEVLFWDGTSWYGRGLDELIEGGNKISVTRNLDGTISIAYFDTTYALSSFTVSNNFSTTLEVGTVSTQNYTFTVNLNTNTSTVNIESGAITHSDSRVGGWSPNTQALSINGAGTTGTLTVDNLTLPANSSFSWFTTSQRSITFSANTTSRTVDNDGNTIPATPSSPISISKSYGWRLRGIVDISEELTAANVISSLDDENNILAAPSSLVTNTSNITNLTWEDSNLNGQERYVYLVISARSTETTGNVAYGWNPKLLEFDTGFENTQNWTMVGVDQSSNGLYYKVFRYNTAQTFANNVIQFKITTQ